MEKLNSRISASSLKVYTQEDNTSFLQQFSLFRCGVSHVFPPLDVTFEAGVKSTVRSRNVAAFFEISFKRYLSVLHVKMTYN